MTDMSGVHAVGFANLYHGEVYGECLCGWSTSADPDVEDPIDQVVHEVRARVQAHVREAYAAAATDGHGPDSPAPPESIV